MRLFSLITFDRIDNCIADERLSRWGHFLGPCDRPFGVQSFGLHLAGELVAVATSASTVVDACAGFARQECVELARLCSDPKHTDLTRVALRLWRKLAASEWHYWPARAYVSYADSTRHLGDIYRFDGWKKYGDVKGGKKNNHGHMKTINDKSVWFFEFPVDAPPQTPTPFTVESAPPPVTIPVY